jgi:hypothetical protein
VPLLFLDVDGVLNCPGPRQDEYVPHQADAETVWVPAHTEDRVRRLARNFEIIWATAWLGGAHGHWSRILGLPDAVPWPYLNYVNLKLPAILRRAGERRWAWVDDDAHSELLTLGWTSDMVTGKLVVPRFDVGLTDAHVAELLEWAGSGV